MKKTIFAIAVASLGVFAFGNAGAFPASSTETLMPQNAYVGAYTVYPGGVTILHSAAIATPTNPS